MVNAPAKDPLVGTVVHDYVIQKRVAQGGMGAVYLGVYRDPRSPSKKAIKILLPEFSRNVQLRERFENEALAVMRLKHPYIVKIDQFGQLPDGQLYLVMDFLDGETLEDHLQRRGRCNLHHTLHIVAQVMSALASMHENRLVHRDLKPANVFLIGTEQNEYEVRLIDLGIARNLAAPDTKNKTVAGLAMGTPGYMAVEQYEDAASATPAADVYAVGVIVWRMLFGSPPWGEVYDERVLYFKQRSEDFQPPAGHDMSPEVVALLRKALSKEPTERPSVADFIAILASHTPAIPPFVKSGAMILDEVARRFVRRASGNDETVRHVPHSSGSAGGGWSGPGCAAPHSVSDGTPMVPGSAPWANTPAAAHTVNERPQAQLAARPTTLSASSGVIAVPSMPPATGSRRRVIAVALCAVAAVATFAIVSMTRGDRNDSAPPAPAARPSTANSTALPPTPPAPTSQGSPSAAPSSTRSPEPAAPTPASSAPAAPAEPPPAAAPKTPPSTSKASISKSATVPRTDRRQGTKGNGSAAIKPDTEPPRGSAAPPPRADGFDPNAIVE